MTTTVLAVCTGNVCRSPAVERLLAAGLASSSQEVAVSSAGTHALAGRPVDPPMAELISREGAAPAPFAARQLRPADLARADLVLVMTRTHRSAVAALEPAAVGRTFLLVELAGIAAAVAAEGWPDDVAAAPGARLAALPRLAAAHRRLFSGAGDLEVPDPYRQPTERYLAAFGVVRTAVDALLAALGAPAPAVPPPGR